MAVTQDYPQREHYVSPVTPMACLAENRRLYGIGEEMRSFVNGFVYNYYKGEPLYDYFTEISRLLFAQRVKAGQHPPSINANDVNQFFLRGSLIAMDAHIRSFGSGSVGNAVLAVNPLEISSDDGNFKTNPGRLMQDSELLKNIDCGLGLEMLRSIEKPFAKEIMDSTKAYYKGIPNTVPQRLDTTVGMLFGFNTIDEINASLIAGGQDVSATIEEQTLWPPEA